MKKKSRANFLYRIGVVDNVKTLLIWDKDHGNITVTNDIENVVSDIAEHEGIGQESHAIIYRDSAGNWDGWDSITGHFYPYPMPTTVRKQIALQMGFDFELSTP